MQLPRLRFSVCEAYPRPAHQTDSCIARLETHPIVSIVIEAGPVRPFAVSKPRNAGGGIVGYAPDTHVTRSSDAVHQRPL